jgi:HSP20 family molecular chaperone IbpA
MTEVAVQKVPSAEKNLPVFEEMARRMDAVRKRAFDYFMQRGARPGFELDDWFTAEHEVFGWPAAELKEKNGTFEIEVTLPGFAQKDVEITATPEEVIIHAKMEKRAEKKDEQVLWSEFGSNEVYRRFALPQAIDAAAVTAQLADGILRVKAPKEPVKVPAKIPVTAG